MADWNPFSSDFWDPGKAVDALQKAAGAGRDVLNWGARESLPVQLGYGKGLVNPVAGGTAGVSQSGQSQSQQNLDTISQFLQTVVGPDGQPISSTWTPDYVVKFLNARTGKDFRKESKDSLIKELGILNNNMGWQAAGTVQTQQSPYTPLAYQQFIQSTIMPYLAQTEKYVQEDIKDLGGSLVPGLRPEYAAVIKQGNQDQKANLEALDVATRNQIGWEMNPQNQLMQAQAAAIAKANQQRALYQAMRAQGIGQQQQPY